MLHCLPAMHQGPGFDSQYHKKRKRPTINHIFPTWTGFGRSQHKGFMNLNYFLKMTFILVVLFSYSLSLCSLIEQKYSSLSFLEFLEILTRKCLSSGIIEITA